MSFDHAATAGATATRHAAVGNGQRMSAQHVEQIAAAFDVQMQIEGCYDEFHVLFYRCLRWDAILSSLTI